MRLVRAPFAATLLSALTLAVAAQAQSTGEMRMYRDPQSGRLGSPPADAAAETAAPAQRRQSAESAPQPQALSGPAGGTRVKFPSHLRAAVTRQAGSDAHECAETGSARE